jgi:hypothetical protein
MNITGAARALNSNLIAKFSTREEDDGEIWNYYLYAYLYLHIKNHADHAYYYYYIITNNNNNNNNK